MSAAEPAQPPTDEDAAVIPLQSRRTPRGAIPMVKPMEQPTSPSDGGGRHMQLLALAEDLERSFNAIGRTLTDDDTADVLEHSMNIVGNLLRGAVAQGILSEKQRVELAILVDGARDAARLV